MWNVSFNVVHKLQSSTKKRALLSMDSTPPDPVYFRRVPFPYFKPVNKVNRRSTTHKFIDQKLTDFRPRCHTYLFSIYEKVHVKCQTGLVSIWSTLQTFILCEATEFFQIFWCRISRNLQSIFCESNQQRAGKTRLCAIDNEPWLHHQRSIAKEPEN